MKKPSAVLCLAFVASTVAAPSNNEQKVTLAISSVKRSSSIYMTVKGKETSELLAASESTSLDAEDFSILADVDQNTGAGSSLIGNKTYLIHEYPAVSGGITCARLYNNDEFFVSCDINVPVTPKVQGRSPHAPALRDIENPALLPAIFDKMIKGGDPTPELDGYLTIPAEHVRTGDIGELDKRDGPCAMWSQVTRSVGDGNAHQNYIHKQLSQNMFCGAVQECSVVESTSKSYSIGWTASAEAWQWISGGFQVEMSWETGKAYSCTVGRGETVCLWYNTAHTAYTVQNARHNPCTGTQNVGGPYVMFSPNKGNVGGGYYCVVGACRNQGDNYWDHTGWAGGP